MDYSKINLTKPEKWNRKILNAYWVLFLMYVIGQFIIFFIKMFFIKTGSTLEAYFMKHILISNILVFAIMIILELYFKYMKKHQDYLVIVSSFIFAYSIMMTISPSMDGRQIILMLPILVSIFLFNKKVMIVTCIVNTCAYIAIYLAIYDQRKHTTIYEFILIVLVLIGASFTSVSILNRGIELIRSIEELVKSEEKLLIENSIMDKLSKTDALTGLYNHKTFHEFIVNVVDQCNSYNLPLQLAIIDIDNFKQVNDTFGHHVGDIVLKKIAGIIKENVTPDDFVARYGGEEFTIIFTAKSIDMALNISEKIRKEVETTTFPELNDKSVTISIGLHNYSGCEGKESLFQHADRCLYSAKHNNKNKVVCSSN